ncbi:unnamed protein product [Cylicocyclus nassatus]|uniref:Uncharacterized protein n=1 Tax=Cylicocyclus nassatus TaxID=53992 RepID=A0AA36DSI6_CYLNA|nr:unnamed protein product [Cylicocyclus nassatus]
MPFNPLKGLTAICCRRKADISKKSAKNSIKSERKSVRRRSPSSLSEEEKKKSSGIISVSSSKSEEKPKLVGDASHKTKKKNKSREMTRTRKRYKAGSSHKVSRQGSSERNKDSISSSRKRRQKIKSQEDNSAKAKPGTSDSGSEDEVIDYWTNPEGIQKKYKKQDEEKEKVDEIKEDDMHTAIATEAGDDRVVLSIVQEPNIVPDLPSKEKIEEEKKPKELDSSKRGQKRVGSAETQNAQARAGLALWKRQKFRGGKQQAATKGAASASATPKSRSRRLFGPRRISSAKASLRQKAKILANQTLKRLSAEKAEKSQKKKKQKKATFFDRQRNPAKQNLLQKANSAESMVKNDDMIKQQLPPKASSAEVLMESQEKLSNEKPKNGSGENVIAQVIKESPITKFSPGRKKKFAYKASKQYVVAGPAKPKVTKMPPIKQPMKPTMKIESKRAALRPKANKVEVTPKSDKVKSQETLEKTAELLYPSPAQEREQKAKEDH